MINEFTRLGQLIFDLSAGKQFDLTDEDNFIFLEEEAKRITIAWAATWRAKELGWAYYLDFHATECQRLLQKLRIDQTYQQLLESYLLQDKPLMRGYQILLRILGELSSRIDLLRYGKNIDLNGLNVN